VISIVVRAAKRGVTQKWAFLNRARASATGNVTTGIVRSARTGMTSPSNLEFPTSADTMMSDAKSKEEDFMILEYKALRSEIAGDIKELRSLETFAVTGIGAIWGWVLLQTQTQNPLPKQYNLALWLPCLITLMLFCKRMLVLAGIRMKGDYLKELEDYFYKEEMVPTRVIKLGWERRLRLAWRNQWILFGWFHIGFFWIATLLGTLLIPLVILSTIRK
jgi:hypothetical protein